MLAVLHREAPTRPTPFEFIINRDLCVRLAGAAYDQQDPWLGLYRLRITAFHRAGYDYAPVQGSPFHFPTGAFHVASTRSLNEGCLITDRTSFAAYTWPDPDAESYDRLIDITPELPAGMRLIVFGPGGLLENVISLVGYENLCLLLLDDPDLTAAIFDAVGSRLLRYYEHCAPYETVGAMIVNDDWGFNTQTFLSPADLRRYVIPWHRRIVEVIHAAGKPAILHSCGNLAEVMDDIIDDIKYDGKHSFEDSICPVEDAYELWGGRIAILGGMDVNFLCQASLEEIRARSRAMLRRTTTRGGYALGSGNSITNYLDDARYFAMMSALTDPIGKDA